MNTHPRRTAGIVEPLERRTLLSAGEGGPVGGEIQVNTYTVGQQWNPAVATDADGDFVVVWEDLTQDGDETGIYGQRFNALGEPQGGEFPVNTETEYAQTDPDVAMDPNGNFVVVWRSPAVLDNYPSGSIRARRFLADGTAMGDEFSINTPVRGVRVDPDVMMAPSGAFVVAWHGGSPTDDFSDGVWVRSFDASANPTGAEIEVDSGNFPYPAMEPAGAIDNAGNFAVAWRAVRPGGNLWDVWVRRFDPSGLQVGEDILVNQMVTDFQTLPDIAMDALGNFVVTWQTDYSGALQDVHARRYDAAGNPLGDEFMVNSNTPGPQGKPEIAMSPTGEFIIAWSSSFHDPDGSSGIAAQRFDPAGNRLGDEFRLSARYEGPQVHPDVAIDGQGDVVAAWADPIQLGPNTYNYEIFARRFNVSDTQLTNVGGEFDEETAQHKLLLQFDDDVVTTLTRSDVSIIGVGSTPTPAPSTFALTYDPATHLGTLLYNTTGNTALPEGRYRASIPAHAVTDLIGNHLAEDFVLEFTFLRGDANGDGRVNLEDFNILAANFGQSNRTFSQGDFNYDGQVNLEDFNILASKFGTVIASPSARPDISFGTDKDESAEELLG